jgi:hypothetical protein
MTVVARPHPPALPHGELQEVLPDLFFVTGTIGMPGPVPMRFSRNMTVVREGDRLILVNSLRLDDAGLSKLEQLGRVTDVIRLAGNHGMDDPFYAERYGAKVWVIAGQRYTAGFNTSSPKTFFTSHIEIGSDTKLPLEGASVQIIRSKPPEGQILLERHGGVLISGDCLQNWATTDAYFSGLGGLVMRLMGFIKPHNVGPGWLKQCKPPEEDLRAVLGLKFANVLPAHGTPVLGEAVARYRPAIDRVAPPRP